MLRRRTAVDEFNNYSHYRNYINSIQKMNTIATQYVKDNIKAYNVYAAQHSVYFTLAAQQIV